MNLRGWVIIYRVVSCTRKSEVSQLVINLRNFTWYDDVSLLMIKIIETWQYKQKCEEQLLSCCDLKLAMVEKQSNLASS